MYTRKFHSVRKIRNAGLQEGSCNLNKQEESEEERVESDDIQIGHVS